MSFSLFANASANESKYYFKINVNNPKILNSEAGEGDNPVDNPVDNNSNSSKKEEFYPFSSLIKKPITYPEYSGEYYNRHVWGSSGGFVYISDDNYSKVKITIPTENGNPSNPRMDIIVYKDDALYDTCDVPNDGNFELYNCVFNFDNVLSDEMIMFVAKKSTGNFLILGAYLYNDAKLVIETTK